MRICRLRKITQATITICFYLQGYKIHYNPPKSAELKHQCKSGTKLDIHLKSFLFLSKAMKGKVIKMGTATVMTVLLVILQNLNTAAADDVYTCRKF